MQVLVAAVDFSKPSRKAFDAAVRLAKDLGAKVVLVHAIGPAPTLGTRGPIDEALAEVDAGKWEAVSRAWVADAHKSSVDVEAVGRDGKPADVVLGVAAERKAALVVVGSHGRTGLKRAVLGSVADAIVRTSKVPVVVVPS